MGAEDLYPGVREKRARSGQHWFARGRIAIRPTTFRRDASRGPRLGLRIGFIVVSNKRRVVAVDAAPATGSLSDSVRGRGSKPVMDVGPTAERWNGWRAVCWVRIAIAVQCHQEENSRRRPIHVTPSWSREPGVVLAVLTTCQRASVHLRREVYTQEDQIVRQDRR